MMTEKTKGWVRIVAVPVFCVAVAAWFGASWVSLFGGVLVYVIGVWVHIEKYGHTPEHLWRPWWWRRSSAAPGRN